MLRSVCIKCCVRFARDKKETVVLLQLEAPDVGIHGDLLLQHQRNERSLARASLKQILTTLYTQISNGELYKPTGCPLRRREVKST